MERKLFLALIQWQKPQNMYYCWCSIHFYYCPNFFFLIWEETVIMSSQTAFLQWEQERATEGGAVSYTIIDWVASWKNQVNFISLHQLQNHRVGEEFIFIIVWIPVLHNGIVVEVHCYSCNASCNTQHGELEIVGTLDWCCEETYGVRVQNLNVYDLGNVHQLSRKQEHDSTIYACVTCSLLPVDGLYASPMLV